MAVQTISTCSYAGEYSTVSGIEAGNNYTFTSTSGYITVHSTSPTGTVLGYGPSPLTITTVSTDNLYPHWNLNAACGTQNSCYTTTVQNLGSA